MRELVGQSVHAWCGDVLYPLCLQLRLLGLFVLKTSVLSDIRVRYHSAQVSVVGSMKEITYRISNGIVSR